MNRAERRHIMKTVPGYKKVLKTATEKAVDDLENMFKQNWNDETLNEGKQSEEEDDEFYD